MKTPVAKTQRFRPLIWYLVEPEHFTIGLLISVFLNVRNLNNKDIRILNINISLSIVGTR